MLTQDSLEFYEEWAIKDGQYGGNESFDEVEYKLDERRFRLQSSTQLLLTMLTETLLIYL